MMACNFRPLALFVTCYEIAISETREKLLNVLMLIVHLEALSIANKFVFLKVFIIKMSQAIGLPNYLLYFYLKNYYLIDFCT